MSESLAMVTEINKNPAFFVLTKQIVTIWQKRAVEFG